MKNIVAYCDTSFIFEYWKAYVEDEDHPLVQLNKLNEPKYFDLIRELLKTEKNNEVLKPLRRLIDKGEIGSVFVSSVLALTEIYEKHAEWNFKAILAESTSINLVFNKGKKDIGQLIAKVFRDKGEERDLIFNALYPNNLDNSLYGIEFKDIPELNLSRLEFYSQYVLLSVFQIGTTDILHLLAAKQLNAKYFLTYDEDFKIARELIHEMFGVEVVFGTGEIKKFISFIFRGSKP